MTELWTRWDVLVDPKTWDENQSLKPLKEILQGMKQDQECVSPMVVYYRGENLCRSYGLKFGNVGSTLEDFPETTDKVSSITADQAFRILGWENVGMYCPSKMPNPIGAMQWISKEQKWRLVNDSKGLFDFSEFDTQVLALGRFTNNDPWYVYRNVEVDYERNCYTLDDTDYMLLHEHELEAYIKDAVPRHATKIDPEILAEALDAPESVIKALQTSEYGEHLFLDWFDTKQDAAFTAYYILQNDMDFVCKTLLHKVSHSLVYLDPGCDCLYYYIFWGYNFPGMPSS